VAEIMGNRYWPEELKAFDFRGSQGIMCVGSSHTIASAESLVAATEEHEGPFSSLNAEIGITSDNLRMRVKLAYIVKEEEKKAFYEETQIDSSATSP
jgi:hypothetical protein